MQDIDWTEYECRKKKLDISLSPAAYEKAIQEIINELEKERKVKMFDKMLDELYAQWGCISEVRTLCSYLDLESESFREGRDLSPYRNSQGKKLCIMLGIIHDKMREIEKVNQSLLDKIEKANDEEEAKINES